MVMRSGMESMEDGSLLSDVTMFDMNLNSASALLYEVVSVIR